MPFLPNLFWLVAPWLHACTSSDCTFMHNRHTTHLMEETAARYMSCQNAGDLTLYVTRSLFEPPTEEPFQATELEGEVRLLRGTEAGSSGRTEVRYSLEGAGNDVTPSVHRCVVEHKNRSRAADPAGPEAS